VKPQAEPEQSPQEHEQRGRVSPRLPLVSPRRFAATGRRARGTPPDSGRNRRAMGGEEGSPALSSCVAVSLIVTKCQPLETTVLSSATRSKSGLPPVIVHVVVDCGARSRWLSRRNCTIASVVKGIFGTPTKNKANGVHRVFTRLWEQHPILSMFS